jgi:hypothetical protein
MLLCGTDERIGCEVNLMCRSFLSLASYDSERMVSNPEAIHMSENLAAQSYYRPMLRPLILCIRP